MLRIPNLLRPRAFSISFAAEIGRELAAIERSDCSEIDDFAIDSLLLRVALLASRDSPTIRENATIVASLPLRTIAALPTGQDLLVSVVSFVRSYFPRRKFFSVHEFVFEEDYGIIVSR